MNVNRQMIHKAAVYSLLLAMATLWLWYFLAPIRKSVVAQPFVWWKTLAELLFP